MDKKSLRHIYLEKRIQLAVEKKALLEEKMLTLFKNLSLSNQSIKYLLSFRPIIKKNEFDPQGIENYIKQLCPKIKFCFPKIDYQGILQIVATTSHTVFVKNAFDIEEPKQGEQIPEKYLDIILTPLLIFDKNGYRVGYGKGMYDRMFLQCRHDALKIGFCFFNPIVAIDDIKPYDIPLNIILTPEKIFYFNI